MGVNHRLPLCKVSYEKQHLWVSITDFLRGNRGKVSALRQEPASFAVMVLSGAPLPCSPRVGVKHDSPLLLLLRVGFDRGRDAL
jgi:hypothetical protein